MRSFVEGMAKDDFLADKRTQQAVIMSLIVIGEAATKVMDGYVEFTQAHAASALAQHAQYAQPHGPWLFRHQPRCGVGYRSDGAAGTAQAITCRSPGRRQQARPTVIDDGFMSHSRRKTAIVGHTTCRSEREDMGSSDQK
jgi:hypothetical protein